VLSKWKIPHSDIHEGAINTAAGRPEQHWRHQHHQAERVAHQNYTIREEAGQSTKNAFLWQITESANDQGKKNKILTKLVLVQCNLFSLSL